MKFQKDIILKKSLICNGFTIAELVIAVSISTFLIVMIVGMLFILHRGLAISEKNSISIKDMAKCFELIMNDVYNPDIYPHQPREKYLLEEKHITFYAQEKKVDYSFSGNILTVARDEESSQYKFFKDFFIIYYDKDDLKVATEYDYPYYCEMHFVFKDNTERIIEMRL